MNVLARLDQAVLFTFPSSTSESYIPTSCKNLEIIACFVQVSNPDDERVLACHVVVCNVKTVDPMTETDPYGTYLCRP